MSFRLGASLLVAMMLPALASCGDDSGADTGGDSGGDADGGADADADGETDGDSAADGDLSVEFSPSSVSLRGGRTFTGNPYGPVYLLAEVRAGAGENVELTASTDPSVPVEVNPTSLVGGGLAEVFARPTAALVGGSLSVSIRAASGSLVATDTVTGEMVDMRPGDDAQADALLADFLAYFGTNHPETGLGPASTWIERFDPLSALVVTHRLYLFEGWEFHLAWHNTIAPYDWAYITARPRDQFQPTIATCLPSQSTDRTVQEADLSDPRLPCASE